MVKVIRPMAVMQKIAALICGHFCPKAAARSRYRCVPLKSAIG